VYGDIYTKVFVVEEGAQLNGNCKMGEQENSPVSRTGKEYSESTVVKEEG
jgi:cytoskeletal protein CcmA (bactofilin family)